MRADMLEKDATRCVDYEGDDAVILSDNKLYDTEDEVKMVGESSRSLSFCEMMKRFSPHHCPLKDQMKDETICYIVLLRPGPPPSRTDNEIKPQTSRKLAKRK